ncbi:MAG: hypothetical protein ABIZ91_13150 [Gemmatimonadaceae bacterium]
MRIGKFPLMFAAALALAACGESSVGLGGSTSTVIELMPDFAEVSAASVNGAGVGGSAFPDSLKLTTEQKATISALENDFKSANAADFAALKAIQVQARAARDAGKSRAEIEVIIKTALPIRARLDAAFEAFRAAVLAVYTPAQRAWVNANKPRECTSNGGPALTEAQLTAIVALKTEFENTIRADRNALLAIHVQAKAARAAGKTEAEVRVILQTGDAAAARIRAAEVKLHADIMALLTAEQRNSWCIKRGMRGPGASSNG